MKSAMGKAMARSMDKSRGREMKFKKVTMPNPERYDGVYIPIKRTNGKEDGVTIRLDNGGKIIMIDNMYMGAHMRQVRSDDWWFEVKAAGP